MSDLLPDSSLQPDSSDPDHIARIIDYMAGTYNVGWGVLKSAAVSSIMLAVERTNRQLEALPRIAAKTKKPGEASLVILFNYGLYTLGPCLGALLLTAFSMESFVRLGYYVALEHRRTRAQRRKGFDDLMTANLARFEEKSFSDRVGLLARELSCDMLDRAGIKRCDDLVRYRNDCVHDSPILWLGPQTTQRIQGKKHPRPANVDPRIGPYERLSMANRPVRLKHVIHAVNAHDGLISHFYRVGLSGWIDDMRSYDLTIGDGRLANATISTIPWSLVKHVSKQWEAEGERMANITLAESEDYLIDLKRRSALKPI